MDFDSYSAFYDRAIRHYLYPGNPKYPGTSVPIYMVKFPFRYEQDLLEYPIEELLKIARKNDLFGLWWKSNKYVPQVKRRKGFYGNGQVITPLDRIRRKLTGRGGNLRMISGYDAPYGSRNGAGYRGGSKHVPRFIEEYDSDYDYNNDGEDLFQFLKA